MLELIWEAIQQIVSYLSNIMQLLKAVHTIVEQKKITKQNFKKSEQATARVFIDKHLYGKFWVLSSNQDSLEHDDDTCKKFMSLCKSANDIISEAPFLSLEEEKETSISVILCHFCPLIRVKFIPMDESMKGFTNSRQSVVKHCCSLKHKNNVINQFKEDIEVVEFKKYNEVAGINVFEQVFFGMKEGFSMRIIQENICQLHIKNIEVGTINHSEGTILKIIDAIAKSVKDALKAEVQRPLDCTGKPRPILETIDKMTHNHHTG